VAILDIWAICAAHDGHAANGGSPDDRGLRLTRISAVKLLEDSTFTDPF